ncbi:hypothetical protein [Bradyrhizobium monzae]|uniref:hypothetical protein n=1 Tax=Bradyrhizobium sp. Oc8 TaxID=2876780 RepID=UPI001F460C59|nr:hypothetical protein [Bradyrhizobium sp. Oc8]
MDDRTVVKTCRELGDWDFVERHVANGRTTEYVPSWSTTKPYPSSVAFVGGENTSGDFATGENVGGTSVILAGGLRPTSCIFDSESYLLSPAYKPADSKSTNEVSASGPDAEAPAVAGEFDRIWRAYGRYGNKQASRQAFEAIFAPDVDHIAGRAAAWAASAKAGQRRMPLEKWLSAEKYDEADRSVKAKTPTTNTADRSEDDEEHPDMRKKHVPDHTAIAEAERRLQRSAIQYDVPRGVALTVLSTAEERRGDNTWLEIQTDRGRVAVLVEGRSAAMQEAGQAHLNQLTDACRLGTINDSVELHAKSFMVVGDTFAALPEADAA